MNDRLALFGGIPLRARPWPDHKTTGPEEVAAALKVLESGYLSLFEGNYFADPPFSFLGGPFVRKLEDEWAAYYGVKHALTVNSATSALFAAIGACGLGPGDEVIVSPYTMSASAVCALVYNAVPVFADVDPETFNLDPASVAERVTERTKAIVVVHIMGHPVDMDPIMELARERGIRVVEDCAQSHGARYKGRLVGTIGDIGVFSLNVNKTIQTGEGGVLVTDDGDLATRLQLIRNHGEVVADQMGYPNLNDIIGFNYRMGEIEAAMASEQLRKLGGLNERRIELASYLTRELAAFSGISPPVVRDWAEHTFYVYGMRFDEGVVGCSRDRFCEALKAEGIPVSIGYVRPLYLQQIYQQRAGYGGIGCPWTCERYSGTVSYELGICPVCERLYEREYFGFEYAKPPQTTDDIRDVVAAFEKVYERRDELR